MTAAAPSPPVSANNSKHWRWAIGVLSTLLVAAVVALVGTIKQNADVHTELALVDTKLQTTQESMGGEVDEINQWISDWYNELRVPERDQRQDSDIKELIRRVTALEEAR